MASNPGPDTPQNPGLTGLDAPVGLQADYWNRWNSLFLEHARARPSQRQAEVVTAWLERLKRRDLRILDVGCGTGWMAERMSAWGSVTAIDLSSGVLEVARAKFPHIRFMAGDFMHLDLPAGGADVVVSLEVLAHVADQPAFLRHAAERLAPGGWLMLSTQNRYVYERMDGISPLAPGLIRRWVSRSELRTLLERDFVVHDIVTVVPNGHHGALRVVNSTKLNQLAGRLLGDGRIERAKERLGLGQTLLALAQRR